MLKERNPYLEENNNNTTTRTKQNNNSDSYNEQNNKTTTCKFETSEQDKLGLNKSSGSGSNSNKASEIISRKCAIFFLNSKEASQLTHLSLQETQLNLRMRML